LLQETSLSSCGDAVYENDKFCSVFAVNLPSSYISRLCTIFACNLLTGYAADFLFGFYHQFAGVAC